MLLVIDVGDVLVIVLVGRAIGDGAAPPLPPLPLGTCSRSSSSKMASSVRQPMKTSASVACFNWIIYLKSLVKIIGPKSRKKKKENCRVGRSNSSHFYLPAVIDDAYR